ncbi:MAG: acyl-CoA dehydrogenase, partial [Bacteroidales bacterium]|nr:acyl-CoA dehydrogenase [Bacteroidales bacterium]
MEHIRKTLASLTDDFEKTVAAVVSKGNNELTDFHARRMVEMAGNIVMGYLLLSDAQRDAAYAGSAELFISLAVPENNMRSEYIRGFDEKELGRFKVN